MHQESALTGAPTRPWRRLAVLAVVVLFGGFVVALVRPAPAHRPTAPLTGAEHAEVLRVVLSTVAAEHFGAPVCVRLARGLQLPGAQALCTARGWRLLDPDDPDPDEGVAAVLRLNGAVAAGAGACEVRVGWRPAEHISGGWFCASSWVYRLTRDGASWRVTERRMLSTS